MSELSPLMSELSSLMPIIETYCDTLAGSDSRSRAMSLCIVTDIQEMVRLKGVNLRQPIALMELRTGPLEDVHSAPPTEHPLTEI